MKKYILFLVIVGLSSAALQSQTDVFSGSFANSLQTIALRMKPVQGGYHGVVQSQEGVFAVSAKKVGRQLSGVIYTQSGNIDFKIVPQNKALAITAMGKTEWYYKLSELHELDGIDLTPYMTNSGNTDYDYGYTQYNGTESERYRGAPGAPSGSGNPNGYNDPQLFQLIAGSQLVIYNRTSYLNDNSASSLTYINYEGSFSVGGGVSSGANHGQNSGSWQLMSGANGPQIQLRYNNGKVETYPVYKNYLLQGRWRIGNTQYAIQRNKAVCH